MMFVFEPTMGYFPINLVELLTFVTTVCGFFFGMAHTDGSGCADGSCGHAHDSEEDEGDMFAEIEAQIAALAQVSGRNTDQEKELANLYLKHAVEKQEYEELDDAIRSFDNAIAILSRVASSESNDDIARLLGNAYLSRAVAKNDNGALEEALLDYDQAIQALQPLEQKNDGDAKYDIAGIELNRGMIFHELGQYDKAGKALDDSFLAFRALEKISDMADTRFYMAKVSIAMGSLYRDTGEPIEKIVDVYNRAMRLLVELIDIGQMEHEHELAVVLLDKCTACFEAYSEKDFDSEAKKQEAFDAVLLDVGRGIEILRRLAEQGDPTICQDLFASLMTQGTMLLDLGRTGEALTVFEEILESFPELENIDEPFIRHQSAAVHENRGITLYALERYQEALEALGRAIVIRQGIFEEGEEELDDEEIVEFTSGLISAYVNRANTLAVLNHNDEAKDDCDTAMELLKPFADQFGEEFQEMLEQITEIRKAL